LGRLEDFLKLRARTPSAPEAAEAPQPLPSAGPGVEFLWPRGAPGAVGTREVDRPTLTVCLPPPELATGAACIICPGGNYWDIAGDAEGRDAALWLNSLGVAGFVLKYRLAPSYHHPCQLQDGRRAIRLVRHRAAEWGVDPFRVGIMGFSGGGHLASTVATHYSDGVPDAEDPVDRLSCRPEFVILAYPAISLAPKYAHEPTRDNLLGADGAKSKHLESLSNERQVTPATPPTFLVHAGDDKVVLPENSLLFFVAMRRMGVPGELHIYEKGGHGFGLATSDPILSSWTQRCADWLRRRGLLEKRQ